MSRSVRLTAAAVLALSAIALAPAADASARLICRGPDNVLRVDGVGNLYYPNFHRC